MAKNRKYYTYKKANSNKKQAAKKPLAKKSNSEKETYPHFRLYLKSNHPALVVNERNDSEYDYRKVTHSEKEGGRNNERIEPNPDVSDNKPMYIAKRVRHDKKKNFSKWKYSWIYSKK